MSALKETIWKNQKTKYFWLMKFVFKHTKPELAQQFLYKHNKNRNISS